MFLPYFFSVVIVAHLVVRVAFPDDMGIVNQIVVFFGGEPIAWSRETQPWPAIIVSTHVWRVAGYQSIIYLASISGIDEQLFEAAAIDGASRPRQIWYITLPMLIPTIIILALLSIGGMLRGDFGLIHNLTAGIDRHHLLLRTDILDTYVFRLIRDRAINFSVAAAVGLYQSVVGFILVAGSNWLVKRYDKDYALF
jgi:putative aldouronate transport system permease protein